MTVSGLVAALIIGLLSCLATRVLIPVLRRNAVLDQPNERSSHAVATPRGGGIALVGAVLLGWAGLTAAGDLPAAWLPVAAAAAGLMLVSWFDDLYDLAPAWRFLAQLTAVTIGLSGLPGGPVFQAWLPPVLDRVAAAVVWVWFVNLFNFMDGIDGLAGSEAVAIGLGLVLLAAVASGGSPFGALAAGLIAGASLGFLVWNWMPARIFMGDVGSVPLGYLLGFLLLDAAAQGRWKAAAILPLYFLADATITLLRRLFRGEPVWRAHRQHFYQRAVRRGLSHAAVVWRVVAADLLLIACAGLAESGAGVGFVGFAAAVVAVLLLNLARA